MIFTSLLGLAVLALVNGNPLLGPGGGSPCNATLDAQVECPECRYVTNTLGYLADPCDSARYYQCVKFGDTWEAYHKPCGPCTVWSQDQATCVQYPGTCEHVETPGGYVEVINQDTCRETIEGNPLTVHFRRSDADPAKYIVLDQGSETVMPCAPGTHFNLSTCGCTIVTEAVTSAPAEQLMCIDFDEQFGQWGFSASGGYWVTNNGVVRSDDGVKGKSGYFNGNAKLEIPYFTNNYERLQFSVSLWFKRASGAQGLMGLLSNGACAQDGSLAMYTKSGDSVQMSVESAAGQTSGPFTAKVSVGEWHHIAIVFDYTTVSYYVDNEAPVVMDISPVAALANRHCPLTLGLTGFGDFLEGQLDEICFFKSALTHQQVKDLCNDVD